MQTSGWIILTILMLALEGFFSMQEVAIASYDPLLLNYQLRKNNLRAQAIYHFIRSPQSLFTTTLVIVEFAIHFGSECSRNVFESVGFSLHFVPFLYIPILVIFGELAPLFIGRRFPHHIAQFGVVFLVPIRFLVSPFSYVMGKIIKCISWILHLECQGNKRVLLQREDILLALRENSQLIQVMSSEGMLRFETKTFALLRKMEIKSLARPLSQVTSLFGRTYSPEIAKQLFKISSSSFLFCFSPDEKRPRLLFPAQILVREHENVIHFDELEKSQIVTDSSKPFSSSFELGNFLKQKTPFTLIIDSVDQIVGWFSLTSFFEEFFGELSANPNENESYFLEKTASGSMLVSQVQEEFFVCIQETRQTLTLNELLQEALGRTPRVGDSYYFEKSKVELVVTEANRLVGAKTVLLRYTSGSGCLGKDLL